MKLLESHFYFIKDEFFVFANDPYLMENKENGSARPCYLAVQADNNGIYWMIPVTSKVDKFRKIYEKKMAKYGHCDTILFGSLLGRDCAFLVQNIFPVKKSFIKEEYIQTSTGLPVMVSFPISKILKNNAKKAIALAKANVKGIVFPDIVSLLKKLENVIEK